MSEPLVLEADALKAAIHAALRAWQNLAGTPDDLLSNLLLVQKQRAGKQGAHPTTRRLATNEVLLAGIESLSTQDATGATILKMRFLDEHSIGEVGIHCNLSQDQVKKRQNRVLLSLTHIILDQENALRHERANTIATSLPALADNNEAFFGITEAQQLISEQLLAPAAPWLIAITGTGGIGKTALAHTAVRRIIPYFHFDKIIWLTVNPTEPHPVPAIMGQLAQHLCPQLAQAAPPDQRDSAVQQALHSAPCLVVLDNLEQAHTLDTLAGHLLPLANPSKFLLTSRVRPSVQTAIYNYSLTDLSLAAATALIRHHARTIGAEDLAQATTDEAEAIYAVTGGNPLALKLVVSLANVLPITHILADLQKAQVKAVEQMYRHIYWRSWHTLSEAARTLLLIMPLAGSEGMALKQLLAVSELPEETLVQAAQELVQRSLLEVWGTTWQRRYNIHRLTDAFLRTEIIHLPEETP